MLKIDTHSHILPKDWPNLAEKYGYKGFIHLEHHAPGKARMMRDGVLFREIEDNSWDAVRRIDEYLKHGIQTQVVCTVPVMFSYWAKPQDTLDFSKYLNDHIAQLVTDYPKHFIGLGTLPMQAPKLAIEELDRCVNQLNLKGVQLGSHIGEWNLDAEEIFPVFEHAQKLGAAILIHPWDMLGQERMPKYWLPWLVGMPAEVSLAICSMIFGGVLARLPDLRVAFAHGGGAFPSGIGRIEHGFNMRPDLVAIDNPINPREYLTRIYLDSIVHDPLMLKYLLELMGPERIMFGTDYPFPLGEQKLGALIESLELEPTTRSQLFHKTAMSWLDLAPTQLN